MQEGSNRRACCIRCHRFSLPRCNRAEGEAARLKRKYEPDDGVIMDIMLRLTDGHGRGYMRALVRTDEYLLLQDHERAGGKQDFLQDEDKMTITANEMDERQLRLIVAMEDG